MAHTYVAGEDEERLASAAQNLGLQRDEGRLPKKSWGAIMFNDDTLTAARMHSVGFVGSDERVDEYGTLHLMSIRKRKQRQRQYGQLTDLFQPQASTQTQGQGQGQGQDQQVGGLETESQTQTQTQTHKETNGADNGDDDEDEVIDMVEGGSLGAAAFGIVKGTVGPAILYLPRGFYLSGYAVSIPAMIFATTMFIFNSYRLLDCWKVESDRNHQVESRLKEVQALLQNTRTGTGTGNTRQGGKQIQQYGTNTVQQDRYFKAKMLTYPELAKRALGPYSVVVETGIALFQFGVCLTYLIFVPDNLHQCIYSIFHVRVSKLYLLWAMIVVEIPLSWIRDIRKLTPTNVVASFLIAFGLCTVLAIAFLQGTETTMDTQTGEARLVFAQNLSTLEPITESWFLFIGTSFFMMEGSITLIVPLQEAVYLEEDRKRFPKLNRNVTSWICAFYIIFSVIACAAFGQNIQTALTASLHGRLATIVQLAYSVAVILTFPLQAFPAMEVAIRMLNQVTGQDPYGGASEGWKRNIFSTSITLTLGVIAVCAIDYLGNVVSILGSLFGIPLALVFPPLMHNSLVKDSSTMVRMVNYCVVVVGFFAMAAASFNTIVTWGVTGE
jgi:proton-coupled amino acid transporter